MQDIIRVAVDAMGGDNAPAEIVKGAVDAAAMRNDIKILLVGQEDAVREELNKYSWSKEQIEVVNADEVIEEIIRQINILKTESISDKELTSVRRYYLSALSNTSESIFSTLDYYISCYTVGVPLNSFTEREKTIHNLTAADITAAAKTYFNTDKMLAAIAGDIK